MKLSLFMAGILVMASATMAVAAGPYVGVSGGVSFFNDSDYSEASKGLMLSSFSMSIHAEYDPGCAVNVVGGYDFNGVRVEGEFGYKTANIDRFYSGGVSGKASGSDSTILSYMINGYYDFENATKVIPFVGAGIGVLNGITNIPRVSFNGVESVRYNDVAFGYQFTAGVSYAINRHVNLDLFYRFQDAASDFTKSKGSANGSTNSNVSFPSSNNLLAGLRYSF